MREDHMVPECTVCKSSCIKGIEIVRQKSIKNSVVAIFCSFECRGRYDAERKKDSLHEA